MKKISLTLLFVSMFAYIANAQTYCQPTGVVPNWAHANSQSLYTVIIKSGDVNLLNYVDVSSSKSYNYLQTSQRFTVTQGQELSIEIQAGIWTWDMALGFDWDGNGSFETEYRAFSTPGIPSTNETSAWGDTKYDSDPKRKALETEYGTARSVVRRTFNVTVPTDAKVGSTFRMRVISDGDASGAAPKFVFCDKISYAGSLHDFGVTVNAAVVVDEVAKPVFNPAAGVYTASQQVSMSSTTAGSQIYFTTDGTDPNATSQLFSTAINVATTTTIKAVAIKDGKLSSIATALYTINEPVPSYCEPTDVYDITGGVRVFKKVTTTGFLVDGTFNILPNADLPKVKYINKTSDIKLAALRGNTVTLTFEQSIGWSEIALYVDYNGDKDFSDEGEIVASSKIDPATKAPTNTFTFTIPTNATLGETRIRVKNDYLRKGINPESGIADWSELDFTSINWNPCTMDATEVHHMADFSLTISDPFSNTPAISVAKYIVFPNPVGTVLSINLNVGTYELALKDLTGRSVRSEIISLSSNKSHSMNVADINAGIYLLSVMKDGNLVDTVRILKK